MAPVFNCVILHFFQSLDCEAKDTLDPPEPQWCLPNFDPCFGYGLRSHGWPSLSKQAHSRSHDKSDQVKRSRTPANQGRAASP